jgi:hypothetical protein
MASAIGIPRPILETPWKDQRDIYRNQSAEEAREMVKVNNARNRQRRADEDAAHERLLADIAENTRWAKGEGGRPLQPAPQAAERGGPARVASIPNHGWPEAFAKVAR